MSLAQLVVQPADPAVGDGRHHHVLRLAALQHARSELAPLRIEHAHQPMGQLDQHGAQLGVARLDQSGVGLSCAAEALRGVTPQNRASCLPVSKRSKRPISARNVAAVTSPTPDRSSNLATIGSSVVAAAICRSAAAIRSASDRSSAR